VCVHMLGLDMKCWRCSEQSRSSHVHCKRRGVPTIVIEEARKLFAIFRDVKEHVQQFETTIAACVALAYENLGEHTRAYTSSVLFAEM
jgi:hypothetical protein